MFTKYDCYDNNSMTSFIFENISKNLICPNCFEVSYNLLCFFVDFFLGGGVGLGCGGDVFLIVVFLCWIYNFYTSAVSRQWNKVNHVKHYSFRSNPLCYHTEPAINGCPPINTYEDIYRPFSPPPFYTKTPVHVM